MPDYNVHAGGWVNINEKATLHRPHIHNQSTFSGVFYVKLPTPDKESFNDEKKSSFIEFIDPRNSVEGFANNIPEFRNSSPFKPQITIEPKEGNLIIFPSWLMHWVYPNPHSDSRISISFNLMLSKKEDLKV